jgi:hypothetical protein
VDFSNPLNIILAVFYFAIILGLSFFSIFGIYILVRYAQSRVVALVVAGLYIFFYLTILAKSYSLFTGITS